MADGSVPHCRLRGQPTRMGPHAATGSPRALPFVGACRDGLSVLRACIGVASSRADMAASPPDGSRKGGRRSVPRSPVERRLDHPSGEVGLEFPCIAGRVEARSRYAEAIGLRRAWMSPP